MSCARCLLYLLAVVLERAQARDHAAVAATTTVAEDVFTKANHDAVARLKPAQHDLHDADKEVSAQGQDFQSANESVDVELNSSEVMPNSSLSSASGELTLASQDTHSNVTDVAVNALHMMLAAELPPMTRDVQASDATASKATEDVSAIAPLSASKADASATVESGAAGGLPEAPRASRGLNRDVHSAQGIVLPVVLGLAVACMTVRNFKKYTTSDFASSPYMQALQAMRQEESQAERCVELGPISIYNQFP